MSFNFINQVEGNYQHSVKVVSSIEDIGEMEFTALTIDKTFYVSRPWLLTIERLRGKDTAYVVTRNSKGNLLGVLPMYWGMPSVRGYYDPFNRFLLPSKGNFIENDWLPTFIVGSRAAYSCELLLDNNIEDNERNFVLKNMLNTANIFSKTCNAVSTSALYITEKGRKQLETVITDKDNFFVCGANAIVDITWDKFEDYLASMKGSIRRERKVFSEQGYKIVERKLEDSIDICAKLFAEHEKKYGHTTSPEEEAKELKLLSETANDYSLVLALEKNERIVGCALLFLWGNTIYVRRVGFDLDVTGKSFEYFNLAHYETIRFAIENGYKYIDHGMKTYQAKIKRGARLEILWGMINSDIAPSPFVNPMFVEWNEQRRNAVILGDITFLEGSQFP